MNASAWLSSDKRAMHQLTRCTHRLCANLSSIRRTNHINLNYSSLSVPLGRRQASSMPPQAAASQVVEGEHKHTNRLANEQSPYLLQHAHNPVDWYPWGEEAFEAAKRDDKPIFLSVGYATCHWCHVMEHESFESDETAAIMNKGFINIKVDREERPDVDRVYMTFVQASTGHGGWPMSVWLTPDLKPFYGGTYYPGRDQYGMPSFNTVLRRIAQLWATKREDLQQQASTVMDQLQDFTSSPPSSPTAAAAAAPDQRRLLSVVQSCARQLSKGFDSKLGGFGGPPKFPRPAEINLLLRAAQEQDTGGGKGAASSAALLLGMSLFSLQKMAAGGMYDQIGGGFHRYSVDEYWHVPHFEKMLYDNPQLALTYLDAFRLTLAEQHSRRTSSPGAAAAADAGAAGSSSKQAKLEDDVSLKDPRVYATVVRGVLDYLRRDMTHPDGSIYSAEDADSLDTSTGKKSEGAFYVWTADEINSLLGTEGAALFSEVYGVKAEGNCTLSSRSDPHDEFKGKNVLMQFKDLSAAVSAAAPDLPLVCAKELLGACRKQLWEARAQRPRPALDDKVVTAWNGQAISAFALAARILPAEQPPPQPCFPVDACPPDKYMAAAAAVAGFAQQHLWDAATGRLRRAFCKAPSAVEGFADDYALLISGLLDLYECGGGLNWLQWAVQLQETMDKLFWDTRGGYFQSAGTDPSIKLRLKEDYDGAEPAASSIAAANLIRLAALLPTGSSSSSSGEGGTSAAAAGVQMLYGDRADAILSGFLGRLDQAAIAMPQMCASAWLKAKAPLRQVIIAGQASNLDTQTLLNAAHAAPAYDKAVILVDPCNPESVAFWKQHNPEAWTMVETHFQRSGPAAAAAAGGGGGGGGATAEAPAGATADAGGSGTSETAAKVAASEVAAAGGAAVHFKPTAFVCQNFTCQAPTSSPTKVYELLSARGGSAVKLQAFKL